MLFISVSSEAGGESITQYHDSVAASLKSLPPLFLIIPEFFSTRHMFL